jgi:hypothetical protein
VTDREAAIVRDLRARVQLLERENRYLRQHRDKARTERDRAKHEARRLHGLLILQRLRKVA